MNPLKYKKRDFFVEAIKLTESNIAEVLQWAKTIQNNIFKDVVYGEGVIKIPLLNSHLHNIMCGPGEYLVYNKESEMPNKITVVSAVSFEKLYRAPGLLDEIPVTQKNIFWKEYDFTNIETRPKRPGKYLICRKDGKIHWEQWNGSGWAYNGNSIKYYAILSPPEEFGEKSLYPIEEE